MVLIDPGSPRAEFHWQGMAPFHVESSSESTISPRQAPLQTPFYSPAPGNPDWRRECLLPGIGQPWCQHGLLSQAEPQSPLAGSLSTPIPVPVLWPIIPVEIKDSDNQCLWIVSPGDTLSGIALGLYGDTTPWQDLAKANGIEEPWIIHPGQCLVGTGE